MGGRGSGKTRAGAEWIRKLVESGEARRIALVARTAADVRDVMVEGPSGLLNIGPPENRPKYEPSKRRLTWSNGAVASTYTADKPEQLRGPEHDAAWVDELAQWQYWEAWDMLLMGLRQGDDPRAMVSTTPKPRQKLIGLRDDSGTAVTQSSSYENRAHLAQAFFEKIITKYEGTRLGEQELQGRLLEDIEGALWTRDLIEQCRVDKYPALRRIVVAIDPAVSTGEDSDETGIIVAGLGEDNEGYILKDLTGRYSPATWARIAIEAYEEWQADRVIGEVNNGGDLVESNIRTVDATISFKQVRATRGKRVRAEPIASRYEQQRIHHVGGFPELEDQMCTYDPETTDESPDRMDAMVWAMTELDPGGSWKRDDAVPTITTTDWGH